MSTKAYYPIHEIGAGKPGFSKTRSIIEAAFYGNNKVAENLGITIPAELSDNAAALFDEITTN